jgi:hypothetical protein
MNALPLILSLFLIFIPAIDREEFKESIDPVILAIDSGSSSELARYFENSISLNINGQQGDFSRNQAEQVIRDFFKKNPPLRFQLVYRSETNPKLSSYIGEYQSGQASYRVFIKINQIDTDLKIYSLGFVKA